ncbi:hypothetical protein ACQ86G_02615 [Roseateles chitinivorans]|uniref:hypothetical protein n=1 Tax=Roseateles chitinivorans TaxID=2917965 RepID=UPI003D67D85A
MGRFCSDVRKAMKICLGALFTWGMLAAVPPAVAADREPIRLWRVTPHPGTTVFILGISHFGSRLEQDGYFQRTVLPAFAQSDVLHFEGGEPTFVDQQRPCPEPLKGTDAAVVTQARALLQRGAVSYFRTVLADLPGGTPSEEVLRENAALYVRDVSEFGLVLMLRLQYRFLVQSSVERSGDLLPAPVIQLLLARRPDIDTRPADESDDLWAAYCGSETRADILRWHVDNFDPEHPPEQATSAIAERQMEEAARGIFVEGHTDPNLLTDVFVCPRNERWLPRLLGLDDGKTHFEALGAAHLFPYEGSSRHCDGLLQDLRRAGMEVSPVQ